MGRYDLKWTKDGVKRVHRMVWEQANGPIPKGMDIHHIDGNGHNNDLSNLQLLSHQEHLALHRKLRNLGIDVVDANDPEVIKYRQKRHESYLRHKDERVEAKRAYALSHKEQIAEQQHKRYIEHKDEIREYNRKYHQKHAAERAAKRKTNPEAAKEADKRTYYAHRETRLVTMAQYRDSHRAIINAKHNLKNAVRLGYPPEEIAKRQAMVDALLPGQPQWRPNV